MSEAERCSKCGALLRVEAGQVSCPACAMRGALTVTQEPSGPGAATAPPAELTRVSSQPDLLTEQAGTRVGRYKLLQQIGEGGFGAVFMAEQTEPVQRKVALKIIKAGMDTREVIARFGAERQALALMDHPNIAQVFDGGATATGRPYFVMELVRGLPITTYCDQANLSTQQRLGLFIQVCRAVQHAHQKGVIHRDLKPSNVLVTLHDAAPVPKIIDFGVAKALGQQLTDKTFFTRFEQMIGTPAYMSPEQAALSGLDIDTRSDVYSLGVLLYELLTGVTPLDTEILRQGALDEIRRMIRETDPPKPSTRLLTLGDRLVEVAKHRQVEPGALSRLVRGDLDWITMKALEKDRQRRYETVNGLAMDIERHLQHEPVEARPASAAYRLQKTIRRHRIAFTATAAVALALILGVVISTWQVVRATRAEREQIRLRQQAQNARNDADEQRKRAEQKADESRRRLTEYADVLDGLAFEYATGRMEPHSPEEALPLVNKALEVSNTNTFYVTTLGQVYARMGREQEALATFERAIQLDPNSHAGYWGMATHYSLRPEDPVALAKARRMAFKCVELTGADYASLNLLGIIYSRLGLRDEAIALFERSVQLSPNRVYARNHLAWEYITGPKSSRAPEKALPLMLLAVDLTHTNMSENLNTLGVIYCQLGQFQKSVETLERGIQLPGSGGGSAEDYLTLAVACHHLGQFVKAEAYYQMGKAAIENGDRFLPVGTREDAQAFRAEVEQQLGKRTPEASALIDHRAGHAPVESQAAMNAVAPGAPATNTVALTPAEVGLLATISRELTNSVELSRGEVFARALQFPQAISEFSAEVKSNRYDPQLLLKLGSLLLETADLASYRQLCHEALQRFENTQDVAMAGELSRVCLFAPLPDEDLRLAQKLAHFALAQPQDAKAARQARFTEALAEYRLGHWPEAISGMDRLLTETQLWRQTMIAAESVLAMARHRLGDHPRAEVELAKADAGLKYMWRAAATSLPWTWYETLAAHALLREARGMIEGTPASVPALTPEELEQLIRPKMLTPTNDVPLAAGEELARKGRFSDAIPFFDEQVKSNREDLLLFLQLSSLLAETGRWAEYRRVCHESLQQFAGTQDFTIARRVSKACLIAPLPPDDTQAAVKLAEFAMTQMPEPKPLVHAQFGKALAEFRQDHFEVAVLWLTRTAQTAGKSGSTDFRQIKAAAGFGLAMCYSRLKQPDLAGTTFDSASADLEQIWSSVGAGDLGPSWHDKLIARVLLREAKALLGIESPSINGGQKKP